jgi:hypothetical protein
MDLLKIAARVAALEALPKRTGEGGAISRYKFDDRHYLVVVGGHKSVWQLCKAVNGKIVDTGRFNPETGELTSSMKEDSPYYPKIEALLREALTL